MKFEQAVVLFPCHSLEDFPVHHEGPEAEGLLAGWTAIWHPALIAATGQLPKWRRCEEPPDEPRGLLAVVPQVCQDWVPEGWADDATGAGAVLIAHQTDRATIVQQALAQLDGGDAGVSAALAAEFYALGFAYLQIELLTRQMRYSSYIDEQFLEQRVVAAAQAAVKGDEAEIEKELESCFDLLAQARGHFYPVDSFLLDLVLVSSATIGASLRDELTRGTPLNLVLSGEVLEEIAQREPETLAALQAALARGQVSLVGGEYQELNPQLVTREQLLADFAAGRAAYQRHLGQTPVIFGRRRFGLAPWLPQVLTKLGYLGAVHATFDGGQFPQADQVKASWEGEDGSAIDIVSRTPLDAARVESFINLSHRIGDTMDHDHVATLVFARWPGAASVWYDDLRRASRFGALLGKFATLEDYFNTTNLPDRSSRFLVDEYRSPALKQAVERGEADPISREVAFHREAARAAARQTLATMTALIGGETQNADAPDATLTTALKTFAQRLAPAGAANGYLLVNPLSAQRRVAVELPALDGLPDVAEPVRVVGLRDETPQAVVDVPSLGFAWVGPGARAQAPTQKTGELPLAEGHLLRNEHFEVAVHPTTGAIQAIRSYARRGNLLSQQLAYRAPSPDAWRSTNDGTQADSVMAADAVEVTASTAAMGELVSRGRLLDREGGLLARFEQTLRLWRGSRVLEVEIALEPHVEPGPNPWTSYFASRVTWSDPAAEVWRSAGEAAHPAVLAQRLESPHFVEIREAAHRLAVLSGGLPYHKRTDDRLLETLLIVRGETARRFRLGIGVDLPHPMAAAREFLLSNEELKVQTPAPARLTHGWLGHLSARNVVATHWEPVVEAGRTVGLRGRLLETEGRGGRVTLRLCHAVQTARRTDYRGEPLGELPVEEGRIMIDFAPYDWVQFEARWKV